MSRQRRDSFIFYRTIAESLEGLPPEEQLQFLMAIIKYALDYEQPQLTGISQTLFKVFRPLIDANWRRYKNGCNGGRDKSREKPKQNQSETETKPYYNANSYSYLNKNENGDGNFNPEKVFGNR